MFQRFVACDTGEITSITVYLIESSTPSSVDVYVGEDPTPAQVLSPVATPQANFPLPTGSSPVLVPVTVPVSPPIPAVAGTAYLLQLSTLRVGGSVEMSWASSGADTYVDGTPSLLSSVTNIINPRPADDLFFSVFITTPTPPSAESVPAIPGIALGMLAFLVLLSATWRSTVS